MASTGFRLVSPVWVTRLFCEARTVKTEPDGLEADPLCLSLLPKGVTEAAEEAAQGGMACWEFLAIPLLEVQSPHENAAPFQEGTLFGEQRSLDWFWLGLMCVYAVFGQRKPVLARRPTRLATHYFDAASGLDNACGACFTPPVCSSTFGMLV